MSQVIRRSGRARVPAMIIIGIALVGALFSARLLIHAEPPSLVTHATPDPPTFTIGPIDGLTTTWHWAPRTTSIPLGTLAQFYQPAQPGDEVIWSGADEVARDAQGSLAACLLIEAGPYVVGVPSS